MSKLLDEVDGNMGVSGRKKSFLEGANLEDDEGIDRVLDAMPVDGSGSSGSSSGGEEVLGGGLRMGVRR